MSIPSRQAAAQLLLELDPPAGIVRHSAAVAEVASFLARSAVDRGADVDVALVEVAALLHDVDKMLPRDNPLRQSLAHGQAGAAWLAERGHPELGPPVAAHPAPRLTRPDYAEWWAHASLEERIVAYADKRAEQDLVTVEQRFARWRRRHRDYVDELRTGLARALALEEQVCALAGVTPEEVHREPWADALLGAAA